jgi:hypothetical protein
MTSISRRIGLSAILALAVGVAQAAPHVRDKSTYAADSALLLLRPSLNAPQALTKLPFDFDFDFGISEFKKAPENEVPASHRYNTSELFEWDRG